MSQAIDRIADLIEEHMKDSNAEIEALNVKNDQLRLEVKRLERELARHREEWTAPDRRVRGGQR